MKITEIKEASPFKDLFEIKPEDFEAIKHDMALYGYDPSHPVTIWKNKGIVVDGHTRFRAAKALYEERKLAGSEIDQFQDIPVVELSFLDDEQAALEYAIHNQTERRNLSDWDILKLVDTVDELLPQGGDRRSQEARSTRGTEGRRLPVIIQEIWKKRDRRAKIKRGLLKRSSFGNPKLDSRERTAGIVGISEDKVSKCRYILQNPNKRTLNALRNGQITLHRAYQILKRKEKEAETKLKKQELIREALKGYNISDFIKWRPLRRGKGWRDSVIKGNKEVTEVVDDLFLKYIPAFNRCSSAMEEIKLSVDYLKKVEMDQILYRQSDFKKFLGSQLVSNLLYVLEAFGFKIRVPNGLKMEDASKWVEKEKKVRVPGGFPWDRPGYMTKAERKELYRTMEQAVKRDIEEGKIKI